MEYIKVKKTLDNAYNDFFKNGSLIILDYGYEWRIRFKKFMERGIFWRILMDDERLWEIDERLGGIKEVVRDFSISPESFPTGWYYQGFVLTHNLSFGCVKKDNNLFFTITIFDNQKYRLYFNLNEIKELLKI